MNNLASRHAARLVTLLLASSAIAPTALAQTDDMPVLEEIVVTAERRTQSLQDVPISATVLSGEDIVRKGVANLADLQQVSPSIAINQVNRSTYVNIRGVGIAQTAPSSSPGVAYYIDGQLIPHEQFISQSFYDIGSLEVLRGPQGTLTGQNSTGGAIYVRTPEPEFGVVKGFIDQTVASYDWFRTTGALNVGLGDNAAVRMAAVRDKRDSFSKNIGPSDSDPGNTDLEGARINIALRNDAETLRINLRGEYFSSDSDNNAVKRRNDTVSTNPYIIQEDAISYLKQEGYRLSGEVKWSLNDAVDLRALTSWQDGSTTDQTDGDRTATARPRPPAANVGRVGFTDTTIETLINEVNLLSAGDGSLTWVVGAFRMDEDIPITVLRDNNNTVKFISSTATIISKVTNKSQSVFGQANYFASEQWELILGARHSWDDQTYDRIASAGGTGSSKLSSRQLTGKVGANYHATDDTMLYASLSKGYKAGGGNLPASSPSFGPETNLVYEAGWKTTLLDRRLRLNGSLFYSDYKDMQLASLANGLPLTQNAAAGQSMGGELELEGRFGALGFNAGLGYLDAEFAKDTTLQNTVANRNEVVKKGSTLPFSPEWTLNAGIQYEILVGETAITPRLQWSHVAQSYATPFPSLVTTLPSRDVVDARLSIDPSDCVRLELFVTNLFDETYIASQLQNSSSADGGIIYGARRQYGGRLTYRF